MNIAPLTWADARTLLAGGHAINAYEHLMTRVDPKLIEKLVEANKESLAPAPRPPSRPNRNSATPSTSKTRSRRKARGSRSATSTIS
jgi:methionyl-tRNA synthetase